MAAFDGMAGMDLLSYGSVVGPLSGAAHPTGSDIKSYLMSQASNATGGVTVWVSGNRDTSDRPVGPTYSGNCWVAAVLG